MNLLLDTHTFLWFIWNDPRLSRHARELLEEGRNGLYLSIESVWEIGIKVGIGKLSVGQELNSYLNEHLTRNRISLLPITVAHVAHVSALPAHHKDPFDRMLVAQSLTEGMPLVSVEAALEAYGIDRRW